MTLQNICRAAALGALMAGLCLTATAFANGDMSGGSNNNGGSSNGGQGGNSNASQNSNAAEQNREGAAAAAGDQNGQSNDSNGGAAGPTDNTTVDQSGAIAAVGQAQQADQAAQCASLQKEWISDANSIYRDDPYREVKRARLYFSRVQQMTPMMLDNEIAHAQMSPSGSGSGLVRWLVAFEASKESGLGVQDQVKNMQARLDQDQQAVDKEVDKIRTMLSNLRSQMATLGCDTSAVDSYNSN